MKTALAWILVAGLAGAPATAQDTQPATKQTSPEQQKLDTLVARFKKHQADCLKEYSKATTDAERDKALTRREGREFLPEFQALADEVPGTDVAGNALLWTLRIGLTEREAAQSVVNRLLEEHMESEVLSQLPTELAGRAAVIGQTEVQRVLDELIEFSPVANVRGQALFVVGSQGLESKDAATRARAREALERVVAEFSELENPRGKLGELAGGMLFKLDKLQVGMLAPDFETVDENGVKWKLSDYKGKVVLLDFWGYW